MTFLSESFNTYWFALIKLLIIFLCSRQNLMNCFKRLSSLAFSSLIFSFRCQSIWSMRLDFSLDIFGVSDISSIIISAPLLPLTPYPTWLLFTATLTAAFAFTLLSAFTGYSQFNPTFYYCCCYCQSAYYCYLLLALPPPIAF